MLSSRRIQAVCTEVAKILRAERERQELSMSTVAERAGLSQQMISSVQRGMRVPTLDTLLRMAAALEINWSDVLKRAQKS